MVPPGLLSQANSLLNRLGCVPLDTALTTAGALDSLLKSKADATAHRNETTGTRSDRGPGPMRLVAMDGTREVDTTVVNWDCDRAIEGGGYRPRLSATTLLAQKQLLDLVKRGELNVATALRRGDLRIIGPQYPDLYVEHRDTCAL